MSTRSATVTDATPPSRRAIAAVVFVVFVDLLGFGIIIPILPFYVRSFGVSDVFIGLLAATYSLAQFAAAPYLGRLSDERGRRPVILVSVAGSAVAWTVFGLGGSLVVLFVSRLVAGAAGGNIAAAQAYISDVTPPERRAGALGLVGAAFGLGFIFGPAIGGFFASDAVVTAARSALPAAVPATQYSLPSFAAAGLAALNFAFAYRYLREPATRRAAAVRRSWLGQFRAALADGGLRPLVVAFFLVSVAFSGVQVMFIPFTADVYGYGEAQAALLLTYIGALGVVVQGGLVGPLNRWLGERRLSVAGGALLLLALVALPFAPELGRGVGLGMGPAWLTPELGALLVVLALLALGNGLLSVGLTTMVSTAAGAEEQGSAFGVTQGAGSLGRTVGPPAMAALYVVSRPTPFVIGAGLLGVVLAALAVGQRRSGRAAN